MINTMNRIAQLTITLSALFCAMSCSEKIGAELPDTSDYITVTSEVDMQTKAGYEGTSVLPGSFYMTIKQGSASEQAYTLTRDGSSNSYNFPTNNRPTWTTADVSQVSVKAVTTPSISIGRTTYGYTRNTGVMSVCTDQTTAERVEASDLLGAKTGNGITISGNNINVAFNHLMSKLQVSYTTSSSSLGISKIELANVAVKGTYSSTDMKHTYPVSQIGTITMFQNSNSAEAIFFPFDPKESNVTPELRVYLEGKNTPITCSINLKDGSRFIPGKLYMMNITISGTNVNNAGVKIENWGANASVQIPGERVLWVGTSIPAGDPESGFVSYPEKIDEAMNCTIVNNSKGGSTLITFEDAGWLNAGYVDWDLTNLYLVAGGLSQTTDDIERIYRPAFKTMTDDQTLIDDTINKMKGLAYDTLIIPYIDGTKDNCTTVIIDHGYNDRTSMIFEALGLAAFATDYPEHVHGYNYLRKLKTKEIQYSTPEEGDWNKDYLDLLATVPNLTLTGNYIIGMNKIIQAIKAVNPNIRIIIGNYFTTNNPVVTSQNAGFASTYSDYMYFANLISYYNEAIAGMWDLDIVNVQNYIWLDDQSFYEFCPDGTHPWGNPESIQAIADVYINALDGVIGSRVN